MFFVCRGMFQERFVCACILHFCHFIEILERFSNFWEKCTEVRESNLYKIIEKKNTSVKKPLPESVSRLASPVSSHE